jgi:hypothetical protein
LQHEAIKDAFFRLGDPAKRKQYDQSLVTKSIVHYEEAIPPFWTLGRIIVAAVVLITCVTLYMRDQRHQKQLAAEKVIAEEKRKQAEALAQAERDNVQAELTRQARERSEAMRTQQEYNQLRQDAAYADRLQSQRSQAQRQQEMYDRQRTAQVQREDQMRQSQSNREAQASEAQARRLVAEDKRRLQELENQRGGGKVIVLPR